MPTSSRFTPQWVTKPFLFLAFVNTIMSLVMWVNSFVDTEHAVTPGRVNSALAALSVSGWAFLAGREDNNLWGKHLWWPCSLILFCALAGYTTYLFTALLNAAYVYLLIRDLKHVKP